MWNTPTWKSCIIGFCSRFREEKWKKKYEFVCHAIIHIFIYNLVTTNKGAEISRQLWKNDTWKANILGRLKQKWYQYPNPHLFHSSNSVLGIVPYTINCNAHQFFNTTEVLSCLTLHIRFTSYHSNIKDWYMEIIVRNTFSWKKYINKKD